MRMRNQYGKKKILCSKCNGLLDESRVGKQRYCKKCHAANMRATRPKHSELPLDNRKKANCRAHTKVYIQRGKILKMPCWVCGEKAEAHHEDYSNPFDVIWLCRVHHLEFHKQKECQK